MKTEWQKSQQQVFIKQIMTGVYFNSLIQTLMQKSYAIKATYKGNMYVLKGYFPTEDSIKEQICIRKIKDLTEQSTFYIQYPQGTQNLQQAYEDCQKNNKNGFKINICKKKRNKNASFSQQYSQNSAQLLKSFSMVDPINLGTEVSENQMFKKTDHSEQHNSQPNQNSQQDQNSYPSLNSQPYHKSIMVKTVAKGQKKSIKNSQQLQLQNGLKNQQSVQDFGLRHFQESPEHQDDQKVLPNFQLSQILEKPPLQADEKQVLFNNPVQIIKLENHQNQKILSMQTNFTHRFDSSKSSRKCTSCQLNIIEPQNICMNCQQYNQQTIFKNMSKSLEQSIRIKIKEEVEFDLNTKIKRIENQLKKEISQLRLKSSDQEQQIGNLLNQNHQLKQNLKTHQNKSKNLESQLNKIKLQFQVYSDKMIHFQKDFQTINQINFELQNSKCILQHKINDLAQKQQKHMNVVSQKIKLQQQEKNQDKKPIPSKQISPQEKPRNILVHQPKQQIKPEEKKVSKQRPKEQLQNLFLNPKFEDKGNNEKEGQNKILKPLDGSIRQLQKVSILKVGQAYQAQISVHNTGSKKWPSEVYIFEKDSKRTKKIPSLDPNQEYIFTDDVVQVGEREGQSIQIKYQVYYLENGQKMYIGLPISIFIKVKKAQSQSILSELYDDDQKKVQLEQQKRGASMINEEELRQSRVQVQGFGMNTMEQVIQQIGKVQAFVKMINEKKRELNQEHQTTKSIKTQLELMGITEENFSADDQSTVQIIEEVIKNIGVFDIIRK